MKSRRLATWTELLEFHTVWIVAAVLLCNVITILAIHACHGDFWTYVRALTCHGLNSFVDDDLTGAQVTRSAFIGEIHAYMDTRFSSGGGI